jgi:hypothetical protein
VPYSALAAFTLVLLASQTGSSALPQEGAATYDRDHARQAAMERLSRMRRRRIAVSFYNMAILFIGRGPRPSALNFIEDDFLGGPRSLPRHHCRSRLNKRATAGSKGQDTAPDDGQQD